MDKQVKSWMKENGRRQHLLANRSISELPALFKGLGFAKGGRREVC